MKKDSAFTLAELLAVITILGVTALIVFPAVNKAIKNSKEKSYNQQVESILDSAENWVIENMSSLSDTSSNYITIGELQQSGYLEAKKVINPITDEEMNGCIVIKYDTNYSQYTYQYKEENCDELKPKLYTFKEIMENSADVMNNDPDGNLRYVGVSPKNYVWFNKDDSGNPERWRIIGVFNGQAKIIRNDYYSTGIEWDTGGFNDWITASLQVIFNNTTDGYITIIQANDPESYEYIDLKYVWNIGTPMSSGSEPRSDFYIGERSNLPGGGAGGASGSETTWTGAIGLMYPSDYGYSTNGDLEICDEVGMIDWDEDQFYTECAEKSWLYDSSYPQRTITPTLGSINHDYVVYETGEVNNAYSVKYRYPVRPVVYLKSNIKIIGGLGTYDQPYELGV